MSLNAFPLVIIEIVVLMYALAGLPSSDSLFVSLSLFLWLQDFVWMRARLPLEVEEQLKKKCFTLLCYHDPNSGEC